MSDRVPDLVQRAAARLQKAQGEQLDPQPETLPRERARVELLARFEPAKREAKAEESSPPGRQRVTVISPATLAANGIIAPANGLSRTTEEFRALKRHVLNHVSRSAGSAGSTNSRVILVTSARAGEGKTFTATNLGLALAYEKDTRVLMIDADAYRQSLITRLGISADAGWLDSISAAAMPPQQAILETSIAGFSVLPPGRERAEIPELMASRRMKEFLDGLVSQDPARFIIIDALPCLTSTEPSILAGLAGQTLFVVAAHKTSREDVESSLRQLQASQSVSFVLNKAEPLLTEQFKGYGYGYAHQR